MSPVGRLVFKTSEVHRMRLVGSTPTSSANYYYFSISYVYIRSRPNKETNNREKPVADDPKMTRLLEVDAEVRAYIKD